jgi:excisionase family DNA binding protein
MDTRWLTVSELAAVLKVSVVSVRRAYWKGYLPVIRFGRMVRFDLDQVRQAIQRNGHHVLHTLTIPGGPTRRASGGASRRRDGQESPRIVKRGRKFSPTTRRQA